MARRVPSVVVQSCNGRTQSGYATEERRGGCLRAWGGRAVDIAVRLRGYDAPRERREEAAGRPALGALRIFAELRLEQACAQRGVGYQEPAYPSQQFCSLSLCLSSPTHHLNRLQLIQQTSFDRSQLSLALSPRVSESLCHHYCACLSALDCVCLGKLPTRTNRVGLRT